MKSESDVLKHIDTMFEKLVSDREERSIQYHIGYLRALRWLIK